jgi:hypothetical protein
VKALFARHHEDAGTLYSLPPLMGLRALTSPNVLRAKHSILQIWQYLGPFVSSCGGGSGRSPSQQLVRPSFRGHCRNHRSSGHADSRARVCGERLCWCWQRRSKRRRRCEQPCVSFGNGQRLRLLLERGAGFKIGTVVGRTENSGGKRHLISWAGGWGRGRRRQSRDHRPRDRAVVSGHGTRSGRSAIRSPPIFTGQPKCRTNDAEIGYREEVLAHSAERRTMMLNNVTIEVGRYFESDSLSGTLSVEGKKDIWEVDLKQVGSETASFTSSNCRPVSPTSVVTRWSREAAADGSGCNQWRARHPLSGCLDTESADGVSGGRESFHFRHRHRGRKLVGTLGDSTAR